MLSMGDAIKKTNNSPVLFLTNEFYSDLCANHLQYHNNYSAQQNRTNKQ